MALLDGARNISNARKKFVLITLASVISTVIILAALFSATSSKNGVGTGGWGNLNAEDARNILNAMLIITSASTAATVAMAGNWVRQSESQHNIGIPFRIWEALGSASSVSSIIAFAQHSKGRRLTVLTGLFTFWIIQMAIWHLLLNAALIQGPGQIYKEDRTLLIYGQHSTQYMTDKIINDVFPTKACSYCMIGERSPNTYITKSIPVPSNGPSLAQTGKYTLDTLPPSENVTIHAGNYFTLQDIYDRTSVNKYENATFSIRMDTTTIYASCSKYDNLQQASSDVIYQLLPSMVLPVISTLESGEPVYLDMYFTLLAASTSNDTWKIWLAECASTGYGQKQAGTCNGIYGCNLEATPKNCALLFDANTLTPTGEATDCVSQTVEYHGQYLYAAINSLSRINLEWHNQIAGNDQGSSNPADINSMQQHAYESEVVYTRLNMPQSIVNAYIAGVQTTNVAFGGGDIVSNGLTPEGIVSSVLRQGHAALGINTNNTVDVHVYAATTRLYLGKAAAAVLTISIISTIIIVSIIGLWAIAKSKISLNSSGTYYLMSKSSLPNPHAIIDDCNGSDISSKCKDAMSMNIKIAVDNNNPNHLVSMLMPKMVVNIEDIDPNKIYL